MHLLNELALKCLTFEFVLLGVTCSVGTVLSPNYILQMLVLACLYLSDTKCTAVVPQCNLAATCLAL